MPSNPSMDLAFTLDADVAAAVRENAEQTGRDVSSTLNDLLRAALTLPEPGSKVKVGAAGSAAS